MLAELWQGWRGILGKALQPELQGNWGKCVRVMEARLRVLQQPLRWAAVEQDQNLTIPSGTRRVLKVFVRSLKDVSEDGVLLEPLEQQDGYWVPKGTCGFPSYTKLVRGKGWLSVAKIGTVAVTLRP